MFVAFGLLLLLLGVPLALRWVRPNRWYGLRLRATFADETVWYDVTYAITCALAWVGATAVLTVRWIRLANRLLRERRTGRGPVADPKET